MDKYNLFSREDIPYYQEWIRKVSNRKSVWIKCVDDKWAKESFGKIPEWFVWGTAWASSRTILIKCDFYEVLHYPSVYIKSFLLHEMGHIIHPRRKHGLAGQEYIATMYALRKTHKLGLEHEGYIIRSEIDGMRNCPYYGRNYHIAYRMLKRVCVV